MFVTYFPKKIHNLIYKHKKVILMKKFLLMGLTAMMTCFLVLTSLTSCGSSDDDEIQENYFLKVSVCNKGTLPDALYQEVQAELSKRVVSYTDLDMGTYHLGMSASCAESPGTVYLSGGDEYQLPKDYAYTLEFVLTDKSGKILDSRKVEKKPEEPEKADLYLHKHVRIYDKGDLTDVEVGILNLTIDGFEELNKVFYMGVNTIEEAKQDLRESLESLKETLPKDKDYTLEFYITDENEEVIYRLYLIKKNGETTVSETV